MSHDDFDLEPVHGLPARLPPGETLLWQGSPDWRSLAVRALHVRKVAIYFALLAAWSGISALRDGTSAGAAGMAVLTQVGLGFAAVALLGGIAWLAARATVYTVTSERLVIRFGIALPMTVNLPFNAIESALLCRHTDGTGDLPLVLAAGHRVGYLLMWPHVRPWQYRRVQPMIRCVTDVDHVAALLADSLRASHARRLGAANDGHAAAPAAAPATTPGLRGTPRARPETGIAIGTAARA